MVGGATVNQTSNSEVVGAAKTEKLKNEQLADSLVATDGGETIKDVVKENDELVKSKALLLDQEEFLVDKQTDASAKQTDSTSTGQDTLSEGKIPSTAQPSDWATTDKDATPISEQEPKDTRADPKLVGAHVNIEPKPDSTPGQEIEGHEVRTFPVVFADGSVSGKHVAAESAATGSIEVEVVSRPRPLESEAPTTTHVSTKDREVSAAKSELVTTVKEGPAILPSAPALIDFSMEEQQVLGVQAMDTVPEIADAASMSAEVIQESSRILYPRLDSIMRGTMYNVLEHALLRYPA